MNVSDNNGQTTRRLNLVKAADVPISSVEWLVKPYIPLGGITILAGDPGSGKTYFAIELAAAVTNGAVIDPAGIQIEGGAPLQQINTHNVIYMSLEDSAATTLVPRFRKQHGDVNRLYFGNDVSVRSQGQDRTCALVLSDIAVLQKAVAECNPKLIVIDPIQAFLGSKIDMYRSNETRPVLQDLSKIAECNHCSIVLISHLKKSDKADRNVLYQALGSIDIVAIARSVLIAGKNPKGDGNHAVAHAKSNQGPLGESFCFSISDDGLSLEGSMEISAADLITVEHARVGTPSRWEATAAFLRSVLADGSLPVEIVKEQAERFGIANRTLERASLALGVVKKPSGRQGRWFWSLPPLADAA